MNIIRLTPDHAESVARLHIDGIRTGFISSLGLSFVQSLYEAIAESDSSFGFVALEDDQIAGFITCTENINTLYKNIIRKRGLKFAFILAGKMFSLKTIRKIFETLFYPKRIADDLPRAELLSIVVSGRCHGKGVGSRLIRALFEECRRRNISALRVLVAEQNASANALYQKCGFTLAHQIDNHGILSNLYTISLDE